MEDNLTEEDFLNSVDDDFSLDTNLQKFNQYPDEQEEKDKKLRYVFSDVSDLSDTFKDHERTNTGGKAYVCSFCDYECAQKTALRSHEDKYHTGTNPFSCTQCDKKFRTSISLKAHEKFVHSEKRFSCFQCDYKFANRWDLKNHERTHTGEKPYSCSFCNYKCNVKSALKSHEINKHTKIKPFSCNQCDKGFVTTHNLKIHERIHIVKEHHKIKQQEGAQEISQANDNVPKTVPEWTQVSVEDF